MYQLSRISKQWKLSDRQVDSADVTSCGDIPSLSVRSNTSESLTFMYLYIIVFFILASLFLLLYCSINLNTATAWV